MQLSNIVFNLKERLYHRPSQAEIELIQASSLFQNIKQEDLIKIIPSFHLIKSPANNIVIKEDEIGDSLYIIKEGAVRVYIQDAAGNKITVANLNKGDYFGEQAILGTGVKTYNENIETIADTTLIKISEQFMTPLLLDNSELNTRLKKNRIKKAFNALTEPADFYQQLDQFLSEINEPTFINFTQDEMIFSIGDKADAAYLIIQGVVSIGLPNQETPLLLHKGNILGEAGILKNQPQPYTAIAKSKTVQLLAFKSEDFKQYAAKSDFVKRLLAKAKSEGISAQTGQCNELICVCMSVYKSDIVNLIQQGTNDFDTICQKTGACTNCRSCEYKILELLGQNPWHNAVMKKIIAHNGYINSYKIVLVDNQFNVHKAGQHIIIQSKINDVVVERPYTISNLINNNEAEVTIKKEPQGLFSQWLFAIDECEININVTQPQGAFLLNLADMETHALCFAGGVGITPFIAYAKSLLASQHDKKKKKVHLVYCALTERDFIFVDEFNDIAKALDNFTLHLRATDTCGLITEDEIIQTVQRFNQPEIYICGPDGLTKVIKQALAKINYDDKKIYIEQFILSGATPTLVNDINISEEK